MFINLARCPSIGLSIYPPIHPPIHSSILLSLSLSLSLSFSVYKYIYLQVIHPVVCLSTRQSVYPSIHPCTHLSICLSICLSIRVSFYPCTIHLFILPAFHPSFYYLSFVISMDLYIEMQGPNLCSYMLNLPRHRSEIAMNRRVQWNQTGPDFSSFEPGSLSDPPSGTPAPLPAEGEIVAKGVVETPRRPPPKTPSIRSASRMNQKARPFEFNFTVCSTHRAISCK